MTAIDAIKTCLGKFFTLSGRASRPEYWWFFLFVLIGTAVTQILDGLIFGFDTFEEQGRHPITMLFTFVTFFPAFAAGWRRMHDTGKPGWYAALPTLIVLGSFAGLMIGVLGMGLIEALGADPESLRGIAAVLGSTGLILTCIIVLVASLLKLYWLTRPGDPDTNAYGPVPPP